MELVPYYRALSELFLQIGDTAEREIACDLSGLLTDFTSWYVAHTTTMHTQQGVYQIHERKQYELGSTAAKLLQLASDLFETPWVRIERTYGRLHQRLLNEDVQSYVNLIKHRTASPGTFVTQTTAWKIEYLRLLKQTFDELAQCKTNGKISPDVPKEKPKEASVILSAKDAAKHTMQVLLGKVEQYDPLILEKIRQRMEAGEYDATFDSLGGSKINTELWRLITERYKARGYMCNQYRKGDDTSYEYTIAWYNHRTSS